MDVWTGGGYPDGMVSLANSIEDAPDMGPAIATIARAFGQPSPEDLILDFRRGADELVKIRESQERWIASLLALVEVLPPEEIRKLARKRPEVAAGWREAFVKSEEASRRFAKNVSEDRQTVLGVVAALPQILGSRASGPGFDRLNREVQDYERAVTVMLERVEDLLDILLAADAYLDPDNLDAPVSWEAARGQLGLG